MRCEASSSLVVGVMSYASRTAMAASADKCLCKEVARAEAMPDLRCVRPIERNTLPSCLVEPIVRESHHSKPVQNNW
jgi:hypothetical protein